MPRPLDGPAQPAAPSALGAALLRRPRAWLVPTGLVAGATALVLAATPPRYTARGAILIDVGARADARSDAGATAEAVGEAAVASAVQTLGSADIARRTARALHLESDPDFDPLAGGLNPVSRLMTLIGLVHDPLRETADARLVQAFESRLAVKAPTGTRVVTLAFTARDPGLAARVVNDVADQYLAQRAAAARSAAKHAIVSLATRIAALRADLADADAKGPVSGRDGVATGRPAAETPAALARLRSEQSEAQTKADAIRDVLHDGRAVDVAAIADSPTIRQLESQRLAAQTELSQATRTLLPEHPRVKELVGQIKDDEAALKLAAKQLVASLDAQAKLAGQRAADLEAALARQARTTAGLNVGRSSAPTRDVQGLRDQLSAATSLYDRLVAAESSAQPSADARVILRAAPPNEPSFPKPIPILLGATLGAMLCSMLWVVARDGRRRHAAERDERSDADETGTAALGDADPFRGSTRSEPPVTAPAPAPAFEPRRGPLARFSQPERNLAEDETDAILLPPVPSDPAPASHASGIVHRARTLLARAKSCLEAFGRPGAEGRGPGHAMRGDAGGEPAGIGWDLEDAGPRQEPVADARFNDDGAGDEAVDEPVALGAVADRIVAGHVPGRGLHVVGTGIGADAAAARDLVALARALAERGRCIVVDLNATPSRLAPLGAAENGRLAVMALDGLAELLAGEASFAEVIHRDHASRLHFIPTGRKEADFRDFDLILDALTETYDFIVLLAPSFPQSEIATVMAPYADVVVLSAPADVDDAALEALEGELTAAGARQVLVTGRGAAWSGGHVRVA